MMKSLLSILLLFIQLCPVTALMCRGCISDFAFICRAKKDENCKAGKDACFNGNMKSNLFDMNKVPKQGLFNLGCTKSQECHAGDFSFTSPKNYFQLISECCHTNLCNRETISLPVREPNGYQCQRDTSMNPKNSPVTCHNNETKCIRFVASIHTLPFEEKKVDFQGCATQDFCDWAEKSPEARINFIRLDIKRVNCSDASPSSDQANPVVG